MRHGTRQRLRLSGGIELSFTTAGEASRPAVLLLHGFPTCARMFREVVPELSQAAEHLDCRGGDLAGQFHDHGLLDQLIIQIGLCTLGTGKSLLPRRLLSPVLRLASVRQMGSGRAELRYDIQKSDIAAD